MQPAAFGAARVAFQQISLVISRQFLAGKNKKRIERPDGPRRDCGLSDLLRFANYLFAPIAAVIC
jgi:hypothetical protein